jgi:hypothetical protein
VNPNRAAHFFTAAFASESVVTAAIDFDLDLLFRMAACHYFFFRRPLWRRFGIINSWSFSMK